MSRRRVYVPILAISFFCLLSCKKDPPQTGKSLTITLYDKAPYIIQSYLQGKWRLQYVQGGISGGTFFDKYNSYIDIKNDRFIAANDMYGVVVDTTITWKKASYGNGSTYLLYTNWYISPYLVEGIYNDTLRLTDYYLSDGFTGYYTRW